MIVQTTFMSLGQRGKKKKKEKKHKLAFSFPPLSCSLFLHSSSDFILTAKFNMSLSYRKLFSLGKRPRSQEIFAHLCVLPPALCPSFPSAGKAPPSAPARAYVLCIFQASLYVLLFIEAFLSFPTR